MPIQHLFGVVMAVGMTVVLCAGFLAIAFMAWDIAQDYRTDNMRTISRLVFTAFVGGGLAVAGACGLLLLVVFHASR